jgi:hypothetical protein
MGRGGNPIFGLTSGGRGGGRGGRGPGGYRGGGGGGSNTRYTKSKPGNSSGGGGGPTFDRAKDGDSAAERFEEVRVRDEIDDKLGFWRWEGGGVGSHGTRGEERTGWLVNMHQTLLVDELIAGGKQAIDLYFIQDDGGMFKSTLTFEPYFFVGCKVGRARASNLVLSTGCATLTPRLCCLPRPARLGDGRRRVAAQEVRGSHHRRLARPQGGPEAGASSSSVSSRLDGF